MQNLDAIRRKFAALVQIGIGSFPAEVHAQLGQIAYVWNSADALEKLTICQSGFELCYLNDVNCVPFDRICSIGNIPTLRDIHAIVISKDVWRVLVFDVITDVEIIKIKLPYLIYSAFEPFLSELTRSWPRE